MIGGARAAKAAVNPIPVDGWLVDHHVFPIGPLTRL